MSVVPILSRAGGGVKRPARKDAEDARPLLPRGPAWAGSRAGSACRATLAVTISENKSIGSTTERQRVAVADMLTANTRARLLNRSLGARPGC